MSAPILFGSPRAQKDYVSPKTEGIAPRYTDRGYTQRSSVNRYVVPPPPPGIIPYGGLTYAYVSGGRVSGTTMNNSNNIESFDFASVTTSVSGGTISNIAEHSSHSDVSDGFISGGEPGAPLSKFYLAVDKFPMANPFVSATNVGSLNIAQSITDPNWTYSGMSDKTNRYGHIVGWPSYGPLQVSPFITTKISKFSFVNSFSHQEVGDVASLFVTGGYLQGAQGISAPIYGYVTGGTGLTTKIDRYAFVSSGNTTNVGTLSSASRQPEATLSDENNGFIAGETLISSVKTANIKSFPFASENVSTTVETLTFGRGGAAGSSSSTDGYVSGGFKNPPGPIPSLFIGNIEKFPFASFSPAVGVGTLINNAAYRGGHQI